MIARLIVFFLLFTGALFAQDTTCNSGDIAWVKDTVNADVGHTSAPTGAEYNNFSAPFGIQRVFDQACAGLDIRILVGGNNYNSASSSWNNRDADKGIDIDTVGGTNVSPILVSGWTDETTRGVATLDFDKASGTFAHAFFTNKGLYVYRDLRLTDMDTFALQTVTGASENTFINVEMDSNGAGDLISHDASAGLVLIEIEVHDGADDGMHASGCTSMYRSEFYDNTDRGVDQIGACTDLNRIYNSIHDSIFRGNGGYGVAPVAAGVMLKGNTMDNNGGSGVFIDGTSFGQRNMFLLENILSNNTRYGLEIVNVSDSLAVVLRNNYYNNTLGARLMDSINVAFDADTTPDATNPSFAGATDLQPTGTAVDFTFTFPAGLTDSEETKGAAGSPHSGGGGGGTTISIIGAR